MQTHYEEASSKLAKSEENILEANSRICQLESQVAKFRALIEVRALPSLFTLRIPRQCFASVVVCAERCSRQP